MSCKDYKVCNRTVASQSISVQTIGGTDTLVIDLPARTYSNHQKYCIWLDKAIPSTATVFMPVAFSIGGVTTTVYPFVRCDCSQVTAMALRENHKYPVLVSTNITSGVFKSLRQLCPTMANNLSDLPVTTTAPATPTTRTRATKKGGENVS